MRTLETNREVPLGRFMPLSSLTTTTEWDREWTVLRLTSTQLAGPATAGRGLRLFATSPPSVVKTPVSARSVITIVFYMGCGCMCVGVLGEGGNCPVRILCVCVCCVSEFVHVY